MSVEEGAGVGRLTRDAIGKERRRRKGTREHTQAGWVTHPRPRSQLGKGTRNEEQDGRGHRNGGDAAAGGCVWEHVGPSYQG